MNSMLENYLKIVNKAVFDASEINIDDLPAEIAKEYINSDQHSVRRIVAKSKDFCDETLVFPDSIEAFNGNIDSFADAQVIQPDMQVVYPDTNTISH